MTLTRQPESANNHRFPFAHTTISVLQTMLSIPGALPTATSNLHVQMLPADACAAWQYKLLPGLGIQPQRTSNASGDAVADDAGLRQMLLVPAADQQHMPTAAVHCSTRINHGSTCDMKYTTTRSWKQLSSTSMHLGHVHTSPTISNKALATTALGAVAYAEVRHHLLETT